MFVTSLETGQIEKVDEASPQEHLGDLIITYWKHTDPSRKGAIDEIEQSLRTKGARLRSKNSASADVLEAIQTSGQRAIVMDGDITRANRFTPYRPPPKARSRSFCALRA